MGQVLSIIYRTIATHLIRNLRVHVPTFTDSYLPAVNSLTKSGTGLL